MRSVAVAVLAAIALLPAAQAACTNATSSLGFEPGVLAGPIPFEGNASLPVTVSAGCLAVLQGAAQGAGTATVTVAYNGTAPSWLTVTPASIVLDAAGCASSASPGCVTASGMVGLAVSAAAPAVVPHTVPLVASLPVPSNAPPQRALANALFNVTYRASYNVTPSVAFPQTISGQWLNFTVEVTYDGNQQGMVMFENVTESAGVFSGLESVVYQPGETKVFNVTYKAPGSTWTEATISFHSFTHYLLNGTSQGGPALLPRNTTWSIQNADPDGDPATDTNAAPVGGSTLFAALAGAAMLAARRRRAA